MKSQLESEKSFIDRVRQYPDKVLLPHQDSMIEGFEYFLTPEYEEKTKRAGQKIPKKLNLLSHNGLSGLFKAVRCFSRNMPGIRQGKNQNFSDVEEYVRCLENTGSLPKTSEQFSPSFPNSELWTELKAYAWDTHRLIVGFTEIPPQYVFADKAILFRYALVFIQEMKKEALETAPELDAGVEVITVYNVLGQATNDIARWLREKHGVVCMANHPMGGLVDTTPLAEKAGMGGIGHSGLLITPEFGPRCRISPIFIDRKIFEFTDNNEHDWLPEFCAKCHSCERSCPQNAIYSEKKVTVHYNSDFKDRTETIDREKCYQYFWRSMGCAVCIKNCPFSKNPASYEKVKRRHSVDQDGDPSKHHGAKSDRLNRDEAHAVSEHL